MDLRSAAKEVYMKFRAQNRSITVAELARRSIELLGESVAYPTLNRWSWQDGWNLEFAGVEDNEEVERFVGLLSDVWDNIEKCENPKALSYHARSLLYLFMRLPEEMIISYQDTILDARERLYGAIHGLSLGPMAASTHSSLIRSYVDLKRYVRSSISEDDIGYDADAVIMGVVLEDE